MRLRFLANEDFAERALNMREAHRAAVKPHVEALILAPFKAELASVAGTTGVDGDAVADRDAPRVRADGLDDAGDLMAEHHRLAQPHEPEAAVVVIMQIGAANAAGGDAHANVVGAEFGDVDVLDPQILGGVGYDRAHDLCSPESGIATTRASGGRMAKWAAGLARRSRPIAMRVPTAPRER